MPTPSSSRVTRTWVNAGSAAMVSIRSPSHLSGRLATRSMPARFSPSTMSGVGLAAAPAAASPMAPPESRRDTGRAPDADLATAIRGDPRRVWLLRLAGWPRLDYWADDLD